MKGKEFDPACWARTLDELAIGIGFPVSDLPQHAEAGEDVKLADEPVVGLLSFDGSDQVKLDIPVGELLKKITYKLADGVIASSGEHETPDAVFGFSQKGNWFVLRDVYVSSAKTSIPGFSTQILRGNSLLVAKKPISAHPKVNRLAVGLDGLDEWLRQSPVRERSTYKEGPNGEPSSLDKFTIEYEPRSVEPVVLFEGDGCRISVQIIGTMKGGPYIRSEFGVTTSCSLEFKLDEPMDFDLALQKWVNPVRDLFVLLMGVYCSIESVSAHAVDTDCVFDLYTSFVDRQKPISPRETMKMPFPYPAVEGKIQELFTAWLNLDEDARNAASIITSLTNSWIMPYDLEFIACASAFEALSRVGESNARFEQDRFDKAMSSVFEAADDREFCEWIRNVVQNRRSAGSLAKALVRKLKPIPDYVVPNADAFLRDHRKCRNAYVHRSDMNSKGVLDGSDLFVHTRAVWLLSYAALLNVAGLSTEEILAAIKDKHYESGTISASRERYTKEPCDSK